MVRHRCNKRDLTTVRSRKLIYPSLEDIKKINAIIWFTGNITKATCGKFMLVFKDKNKPLYRWCENAHFHIIFRWNGFQSFLDFNDSKLLLVLGVESCSFPTSMKISTSVIVRRTRRLCYLLHYTKALLPITLH